MKRKIFAVVVIYNVRENDVKTLLEILLKQVEKIIVCNNSGYELKFNSQSIIELNFKQNIGIARAQSIGMKRAFREGADFVLQMDQDSIPDFNMVAELVKCFDELELLGYKVGLVGVQDYDKDTNVKSRALINKGNVIVGTKYKIVSDILSSGSLISKNAYLLAGGMDDDLFIDIVDFEYCWRLIDKGMLVIKNENALLAHKLGNGTFKLFGLFKINLGAPFRHYYQFRNILFMIPRKYVPVRWKIVQLIKLAIKFTLYPLGLKDGITRWKYMCLGIKDFFLNKKGIMDNGDS